ncbi:protein MCM10 homolog [Dendronephthya gigantea]|uniref:protein MCM10 homolog n=1 Tax=Dendronephthya gigantea TaxID=151771 RepID=UPI001069FF82|nr:protein MCM10 homolog [Dendronephthya gigantea]
MEKYIKFLEAQLKSKNEEKKTSPENKSNKENPSIVKYNAEDSKTEKQLNSQNSPTRAVKKINKSQTSSDTTPFGAKPKVAHTSKNHDSSVVKIERKSSGQKRKAEEPAPHTSSAKKPAQDSSSALTDEYSGLRIVNPCVSSTTMKRRMEGRKMIKISSIQSNVRNNDVEGDWVTIGVLIQKTPKTTAKGEAYSIWKLSDLAFHLQTSTISLFLFGESHKEHWKTVEGSAVALLNPSVLPPREKQSSQLAFSLDNPKKLMMIGMSQDFGVCQSSRKSDGKRCSNFVNKSQGNFCQYHVQREYSKKRSKRMECQQGYGAPSKYPSSKLKQKIAGESFFYGGQLVSSSPASAPLKEKVTLKSLAASSSGGKNYLKAWKEKQNEKKISAGELSGNTGGSSEDFLRMLSIPSVGSRNLTLHLHKEDEKEKEENDSKPMLSVSEFLKANTTNHKSSGSKISNKPSTSKGNPSSPTTPLLGRGLDFDDDVIFEEKPSINFAIKSSSNPDKAKKQALAIVRQVGPITPKDPNNVRIKKPSPKLQDVIKKKLETDDESALNSGKSFSLADGFSLDSPEGQRILKAKSKHVGEVRQAELAEEQVYFSSREKKEEMETKMLLTKEIKVKVFQCEQCNYVAEKPGVKCKEEKHKLTQTQAMKKFFSCRDCSERTIVYGQRYPTRECRKCGANNWEKCGMWKEKSGPKVGGETLMLRGPEHGKYLNSLQMPKTNGILPKYL